MSGAVLAAFIVISLILSLIWRARDKRVSDQNADLLEALSEGGVAIPDTICLLYTSPSPRDRSLSRMPSSA